MVCQDIADSLSTDDPELLSTHLSVLAQLVLRSPDAFESKSDIIMKFLLKQVILANPSVDEVRLSLQTRS